MVPFFCDIDDATGAALRIYVVDKMVYLLLTNFATIVTCPLLMNFTFFCVKCSIYNIYTVPEFLIYKIIHSEKVGNILFLNIELVIGFITYILIVITK